MAQYRAIRATGLVLGIAWGLLACGGGGGGGSGGGTSFNIVISGFDEVSSDQQFSLPLSITGSPDGAQFNWEVQDAAGGSVQGSQRVGALATPVYGVDVSELADGPLTLLAQIVDVAGATTSLPVLDALKDTLGPAAVLLALPASTIDAANQGAFSFNFTLADPGDTGGDWFLTVRDSLGLELSFTGAVDAANTSVGPLDLSALNAGTVTFLVSISDRAGNPGAEANVLLNKSIAASQPTISGRVTFDQVPHRVGSAGLDYAAIEQRPVRGARVQLLDNAGAALASTDTDGDGNYVLSAPANTAVRVEVLAHTLGQRDGWSWDVAVTDNTMGNAVYALQGALLDSGTVASVRDLHAASGWTGASYGAERSAAPFAILDAAWATLDYVIDAFAVPTALPAMEFRWSESNTTSSGSLADGDIGTSFYDRFSGNVYLLGREDVDTDEYDPHVIVHEWAHYLAHRLSREDSIGGSHTITQRLDLRVAFAEGLSSAVAGRVLGPAYRDTSGPMQAAEFNFTIDAPITSAPGWFSEDSIQKLLYELMDVEVMQGGETFSGAAELYRALLSGQINTQAEAVGIHAILAHIYAEVPALQIDVNALATAQQLRVSDVQASSEDNDGGLAFTLPVYRTLEPGEVATMMCSSDIYGVQNKHGNRQFALLSIPAAGTYQLRAQRTSGVVNSDPDMVLWRAGALVAVAQSADIDAETWVGDLLAGQYLVELYEFRNTDSGYGEVCFELSLD